MSTPKHMRRDVPVEDAPRRAPGGVSDDSPAPLSPDASPAATAEEKSAQVGRSAALMSGLVIVSRLTGFFRTWGQAYAIGVTVMASCYSVANNLPNSLYELVVAGMLTTAFLPVYMSVKKRAGRAGADEYTSNLVSIILVVMGATAVLGFIFAAQLVWTQSFSASSDFDFDLTVWFFRFFVIEVVLYALSTIISGVLNAERDYLWSSAAPIFNNFVTTASFFAYAFLAPTNPQLALVILALGNPVGVAIQVLVQLPSLRKHGVRLRWHINFHDPDLMETVKIGVPSLVVMLTSFVTTSVQSSSSLSVTASGASIMYYARLWYTLPYAILTVPITTAMFTELSDSWAKQDLPEFRHGIASGLSQIFFFMVPFMLYLIVFSVPLISVIAAGNFTPDEIWATAQYLIFDAIALPVYAVCMYLQKVVSAMRQMILYAVASIIASVLQVVILLAFTPYLGLNFVAASSFFFFAAIDLVMFVSLRRKLGQLGMRSVIVTFLKSLAIGAAGAGAGFALLSLLNATMGNCSGATMRSILYCVLAGVPALIVTYGLAFLLRMPEARLIKTLTRRFLRRR